MHQLQCTELASVAQLISVYPGYLSPYGLHLSPKDSWFHLRKMAVNGFLKSVSISYCPSFMFCIRSLQQAVTGCVLPVVPALEILLLRSGSGVTREWQQQPILADVFHGPCPYVGITAPRQMAPICLRVPSKSRKGAVVVCSHPVMIKSPSPSYTESCHQRSTKYGNEIVPQKYVCFNRVPVKISKTQTEKLCNEC